MTDPHTMTGTRDDATIRDRDRAVAEKHRGIGAGAVTVPAQKAIAATRIPVVFTGSYRAVKITLRRGQRPAPQASDHPGMKHQASSTPRAYAGACTP